MVDLVKIDAGAQRGGEKRQRETAKKSAVMGRP